MHKHTQTMLLIPTAANAILGLWGIKNIKLFAIVIHKTYNWSNFEMFTIFIMKLLACVDTLLSMLQSKRANSPHTLHKVSTCKNKAHAHASVGAHWLVYSLHDVWNLTLPCSQFSFIIMIPLIRFWICVDIPLIFQKPCLWKQMRACQIPVACW